MFVGATLAIVRRQVGDFVALPKPCITLLVLVTTFTGMWLASTANTALNTPSSLVTLKL